MMERSNIQLTGHSNLIKNDKESNSKNKNYDQKNKK